MCVDFERSEIFPGEGEIIFSLYTHVEIILYAYIESGALSVSFSLLGQ